jgi:glutamate N-acetyltransferase/amino-acid N-acetyltransferase
MTVEDSAHYSPSALFCERARARRGTVTRREASYTILLHQTEGSMYTLLSQGSITTPNGFEAGAAAAGVKYPDRLDLAVIASDVDCTAAGVFTRNAIRSAPVLVSEERVAGGRARAVVANSGCANACTGRRGVDDARAMAALAARLAGVPEEMVLVAGTGVIGTFLPMDRIERGIKTMKLSREGGRDFARAIMTTDTRRKEVAATVDDGRGRYSIGAAAKGSGMIHPNMGTLLAFITTDAAVEPGYLKKSLARAVDATLNMVTVDGDTSPSDTAIILANGAAGLPTVTEEDGGEFADALQCVCERLAREIAADGEGATRLIEVTVTGARSYPDARISARTVAASPLVKSAVNGADPNWGRIVCAVGRSGAAVDPDRVGIRLNGVTVMESGVPAPFNEPEMRASLTGEEILIEVSLGLGKWAATAWGCDLSQDYVTINASYTT